VLQLQPIKDEYREKGLEIINLSSNPEEVLRSLWEDEDLTQELFIDEDHDVSSGFGVGVTPAGVFIGKEGSVKESITGWGKDSGEEFKDKVEKLLEE